MASASIRIGGIYTLYAVAHGVGILLAACDEESFDLFHLGVRRPEDPYS
jgi:hypothetical protein